MHISKLPPKFLYHIALACCVCLTAALFSSATQAQVRYVKTFTESVNTFSDREGTARSQPYGNNLNNFWLVKPTNPLGTRLIILRFDSLNTQRTRDVVRIFAGGTTQRLDTSRLLATISGANPPGAVIIPDSAVTVQFVTDGSIAGETRRDSLTGWTITYFAITNVFTAAEGVLRDREGATRQTGYQPNLDALWLIRPQGARQMLLQFDSLNLEEDYDFVNIFAGVEEPRFIGGFTGSRVPPSFAINDSLVIVRFTTDFGTSGDDDRVPSGWTLRYVSSTRATVLRPDTDYLYFGDVVLGEQSPVRSLRISGSSFIDDITVIAPEGFSIATSPTDVFRDTVRITVPKNSIATSRGQVFIRFNPKQATEFYDRLSIRSGTNEEFVDLGGIGKPFVFWESTGGPNSGQITTLGIAAGNTLLAGTRSGIYRSNSNGAVWLSSSTGLNAKGAQRIYDITIGQARDTIVYVNTDAGMYFSLDSGKAWRPLTKAGIPESATVFAMVQYRGRLLAGTKSGLYRYVLLRNRWERSMQGFPKNDIEVRSLTVHDSSIVAGTRDYGIFISADTASTWKAINGENSRTSTAVPLEDNDVVHLTSAKGILFAIVDNIYTEDEVEYVDSSEVLSSKDNGTTWQAEDLEEINDRGWWKIYSVLLVNNVLYLGTDNGVARRRFSDTSSSTIWNFPQDPAATGLTESTIVKLITNGSTVYAGTLGGVFRSNNQGLSWQSVNTGLTATSVTAMTNLRGTVLAATEGSGIFRSSDNGTTWQQSNNGLRGVFIGNFVQDGSSVLTCVYNDRTPDWANNGVFRSLDNGQSWTLTGKFPDSTNVRQMSPQPDVYCIERDDQNVLYAGTLQYDENFFFASTTGGVTWRMIDLPLVLRRDSLVKLDVPIYDIEDGPGTGIFIATYGEGVFWSPNPLARPKPQWTRLLFENDGDEYYSNILTTFNGDLYVGTEAGLHYANAARTRFISLSDTVVGAYPILSLYVLNGMLYAGVSEHGVWRSADGDTWEQVNIGFFPDDSPEVYSLTADGVNIYAGLDGNAIHRTSLTQTATAARALLSVPETYAAQPGDTLRVSVFLQASQSLPELAPTLMPTVTGVLRFNASLLEPVDDLQSVVVNGERLVNFRAQLKSPAQIRMSRDSSLITFRFRALLGNSVATPLSLTNLSALNTTVISRRPGLFTLRGLSDAGGTRLFVAESKPTLALVPNPTSNAVSITLKTFESGMTTVNISNVFGQNVKTVVSGEILAGEYDLSAALSDLPQGVYFVNVQTPTQRVVRQVQLVK
ncbi:MAG: T9SS type A sorting domain-containing protein [Candidatus Kapabacteria bacterium]|jgi:ligand-binding sensor domain-containing protein|nr:T9SS type A sorting domain-containing protein [Candidatus Kapabacteria bacterium]